MFTRAALVATIVVVSSCGSSNPAPATTTDHVAQPSCVATRENPSLGLVALTDRSRVRLWNEPGIHGHRDFELIGDDPTGTHSEGDLTVAESVAVVPGTCAIFVGACCEPVSGVTYYGGDATGEWKMLFGRLPTVSPDGGHLAVVGWDSMVVSTTAEPDAPTRTFKIPPGGSTVMVDSMWIDNDRIVVMGYTDAGTFIWLATVSNGNITPAVKITGIVTSKRPDVSLVHLAGTDTKGNIMVVRPVEDGQELFRLAPEMMDATSSEGFPGVMLSYFDNGVRAAKVDPDGVLTVRGRDGAGVTFGGGYQWAR